MYSHRPCAQQHHDLDFGPRLRRKPQDDRAEGKGQSGVRDGIDGSDRVPKRPIRTPLRLVWMRARGAAMKGKSESAEQSPEDDCTQQTPVHDLNVPTPGLDAAESPLELQH